MRRFNIFLAFVAVLITSCYTGVEGLDYPTPQKPSSRNGLQIIGAVEGYDVHKVGTRATDDIADSYISEMTMFIFKSNGDLLQGYSDLGRTQKCTSAINIQRGNPTFLVDTEEGILADLSGTSNTSIVYYKNDADDLGACKIYIVANIWHQLKDKVNDIKTLSDLEAFVYQADGTLAMPMADDAHYRGFPMIGTHLTGSFKLKKGDDNEGNAVATIPLKKLYSKVNFTMQINANQVVAGQTPKFTISKVEVFNVPKMARLGRSLDSNGKPVYGTTTDDDYLTEMGVSGTYEPAEHYHFTDNAFVINQFNKTTIYHSTSLTTDDVIKFGFYMPEHKVTPNTITYPENIDEEFKQYYKPKRVGQVHNGDGTTSNAKIATFVRIHGSYTDHNGQILGVKYDIYLGQNNTDDFTVKRNQLLNNKLIITGLTNHKDAYPDVVGNISIDHRVEIEDRGFNLSMERTAILDSHFEVRPLDIELSAHSSMEITIPEAYRDWVAMEDDAMARSGVNKGLYVNTTTARKGVRKYFTTDLVAELNGGNKGTIELINNKDESKTFRIWFYIDENPNVYDKKTGAKAPNEAGAYTVDKVQYRVCPVKFRYEGRDKDGNELVKDATINFQQWNLWRVWSADGNRYYDIEHEEEYLNNYASDAQYGQTQDGMAYGLDGLKLSNKNKAVYINAKEGVLGAIINLFGGSYDSWINSMIDESGLAPFYDFYLERDTRPENVGYRNYAGRTFNEEIVTTLKNMYADDELDDEIKAKIQVEGLTLTAAPKSAIAYCYHKNKRDEDGNVVVANWYLPSIDEIEEISMGAYDEFDQVFQNNKYWSCQPSAFNNILRLERERWFIVQLEDEVQSGTYMGDNPNRARATSVLYNPSDPNANAAGYVNISSGVSGTEGTYTLHFTQTGTFELGESGYDANSGTDLTNYTAHPGNLPRTASCRIRAVYRSGTK